MADISKCTGDGCEKKHFCYRFTAKSNEIWQSYIVEPPIEEDGKCDYFWEDKTVTIEDTSDE